MSPCGFSPGPLLQRAAAENYTERCPGVWGQMPLGLDMYLFMTAFKKHAKYIYPLLDANSLCVCAHA